MSLLERILEQKRSELPGLRRARLPAPPTRPPISLRRAPGAPLHLICEIKKRSPSAGPLDLTLSVSERARVYAQGGASMLSVLCDQVFFDGGFADLLAAREGTSLPLLAKEFIIDESQLDHAAAYGASAALLIVRCLEGDSLPRLVAAAKSRGLTALVEVTTEEESARALDAGATHIGVNARDLDTLVMDASRAERVLRALPPEVVVAHFSGIRDAAGVTQVASGPAHAALIGEALMRRSDPLPLLQELRSAAR